MKTRIEIIEKKYLKILNEVIKEFISKQGLDYDDLEYYDYQGFKIGDIKFHYDIIIKDLKYNAPVGAVFNYFDDYVNNPNAEKLSYKDFIKRCNNGN